jgi:hypothetical protein
VDEHRHQWSVVDFYVERDRPMMRQACACGVERSIHAWDRFWDPQASPSQTRRRQDTSELVPCLLTET